MKIVCHVSSVDALRRKVAAYKELFSTPVVKVSGNFEAPNGDAIWLTGSMYHVTNISNRYITIDAGEPKPIRARITDAFFTQVTVELS